MELCILIPAKDEEETIEETIENLQQNLAHIIPFNILVVNDYSKDNTQHVVDDLSKKYPNVQHIFNESKNGVGGAIRFGLSKWKGDVISLCMADGSDSPEDILRSFEIIEHEDVDCVFGSRFIAGGKVSNYPFVKLVLNRVFNSLISIISRNSYNDYTNIFKVYSRKAIEKIGPLESIGFSIGLEMSLKAFKRRLKISVVPISWSQRKAGESKLNLIKNFNLYVKILIKSFRSEIN